MCQSQTRLEMRGLQSQKGFVVDAGQIIMPLLGVDICTEIERSQVFFVNMENLTILSEGIVPLFEVDIGLCLKQMQMQVLRIFGNMDIKRLKRIAPLLPRLRWGGMKN